MGNICLEENLNSRVLEIRLQPWFMYSSFFCYYFHLFFFFSLSKSYNFKYGSNGSNIYNSFLSTRQHAKLISKLRKWISWMCFNYFSIQRQRQRQRQCILGGVRIFCNRSCTNHFKIIFSFNFFLSLFFFFAFQSYFFKTLLHYFIQYKFYTQEEDGF